MHKLGPSTPGGDTLAPSSRLVPLSDSASPPSGNYRLSAAAIPNGCLPVSGAYGERNHVSQPKRCAGLTDPSVLCVCRRKSSARTFAIRGRLCRKVSSLVSALLCRHCSLLCLLS